MTFRFILAIILLLCGLIGLFIGNRKVTDGGTEYPVPARSIGLGLLAASALFFLLSTVRIVSPGEVGIPVTLGKTGTPFGAGIHFVNPLSDVQTLSVRTENYTMSGVSTEGDKGGNDAVPVLGSDGAPAEVESTVLFHLNTGDAGNVFKELGTSYVDKIVRPAARSCIRDEFGKNPLVVEATSGRTEVSVHVQNCIERETQGRGITVESLQLRDIKVDQHVQDSINAKVAAQQASEQQAFELTKTQQQAEIARVDAQGKADSQQIIACGGTTLPDEKGGTKVIPRQGGDCLNTLTPAYLQYLYIQALTTVANSPNNSTVIIPFDQNLTPLLNLNSPGPK